MLAEDNLPDALLVREAIRTESLPLEVFIVPDGERAIEFITRAESDPDAPSPQVVLLDLNLPRIDGFEVLRRLRATKKFPNIPGSWWSRLPGFAVGSKRSGEARSQLFPKARDLRGIFGDRPISSPIPGEERAALAAEISFRLSLKESRL